LIIVFLQFVKQIQFVWPIQRLTYYWFRANPLVLVLNAFTVVQKDDGRMNLN